MQTVTNQEPRIIIKGNEVSELNKMLDTLPHGEAKKVIAFINACQKNRQDEQNRAAFAKEESDQWTRMNEEIEFLTKELNLLKEQNSAKQSPVEAYE